jgi:hypothetical protein
LAPRVVGVVRTVSAALIAGVAHPDPIALVVGMGADFSNFHGVPKTLKLFK